MILSRPAKKFKCKVCGEPIHCENATHDSCKEDGLDSGGRRRINIYLDRAYKEIKEGLSSKVKTKTWSKKDGKDKLRELFPDMVDRL